MNAVERIEAAIQKLETLKAESTQGEWRQPRMLLGLPTTTIFSGSEVVGYAGMQDGELIVTLHRTIDAQLAILREGVREFYRSSREYPTDLFTQIVALADAILGDAPAGEVTRLSGAWCLLLGYEILDPDGWDRGDFQRSWNEPITQAEFRRRARQSTHRRVGVTS